MWLIYNLQLGGPSSVSANIIALILRKLDQVRSLQMFAVNLQQFEKKSEEGCCDFNLLLDCKSLRKFSYEKSYRITSSLLSINTLFLEGKFLISAVP
jgi:hypothetical protein